MNSVQVHLAITHVPVILSIIGLIMFIVSILIKNHTLTRTSYIVLVLAGITAIPVYFSGEGAEEAVEHLPGITETAIETHEEVAKLAMIFIAATGAAALAALFLQKFLVVARLSRFAVLLLALVSGMLMTQTAHLGGQIRHTELRNSLALQNGNEAAGNESGDDQADTEEDD